MKQIQYTQNFLISKPLVKKLVRLANIETGATVLEVGPGKGIITTELAECVGTNGNVIAVELDPQLSATLTQTFAPFPQVTVVQNDILQLDLPSLIAKNRDKRGDYVAFANVPFNITADLLQFLFNPSTGPTTAHLILQTDALIGINKIGLRVETFKSLLIKPLYQIEEVHPLSRADFRPKPSVDTALFRFERRDQPLIAAEQYRLYQDFLAFVAKDRVGEGTWLKLFTKKQINRLATNTELVPNRGLKSQTIAAIMAAFELFSTLNRQKQPLVHGAMAQLKKTQQRTNQINQRGGHHRSRRNNTKHRRAR